LLALALLALALAGALALWAQQSFLAAYRGFAGDERRVVVEPGSGAAQILNQLQAEGVLADARLARLYLVYALGDPPLLAGEYSFSGAATGPQVLAKITGGEVVRRGVTVIEGLTLEETADSLAKAGFGQREAFLEAMRSPSLIADLDPRADDLEGYLFPDTYSFTRDTGESAIVATLVRTFRQRWRDQVEPLIAAGNSRGVRTGPDVGPREVVILASIVEKEAGALAERPLVAAVYANRLSRGIGLYADPTIIFALKRRGTWDGNLRRADLKIDSPYNTYRYPGLPPGPIASPGLASLKAAAAPAEVDYLYFVSKNDGTHAFSRSLAEHNRNVQQWQRQYWRDRWAEERRQKAEGAAAERPPAAPNPDAPDPDAPEPDAPDTGAPPAKETGRRPA
jgi:UPF0755 protein